MASSTTSSGTTQSTPRARIRSVFPKLVIGRHPTGKLNSITDVPGVLAHTESIRRPNTATSHAVNTGVTTILPRKDWFHSVCHAGIFSFNGSGEMTGSHWIEETGQLRSPIIITNSFGVGACYDGVYKHAIKHHADPESGLAEWFLLPVITETFDGYCNDIGAMAVTPDMVVNGIAAASADAIPEGCTGGGTGMMCQGYKAGTGSASRLIAKAGGGNFTVGVVVQANYGKDWDLHIGRVPVGKMLMDPAKRAEHESNMSAPEPGPVKDGSIIVIIATDAPLNPTQCKRLAKRATSGLARVGGWGSNTSGDVFLAFSTGVTVPGDEAMEWKPTVMQHEGVLNNSMNALFEATADCVEESIYNSLSMAETTVGPKGRTAHAIDLDKVRDLLEKHYVTG